MFSILFFHQAYASLLPHNQFPPNFNYPQISSHIIKLKQFLDPSKIGVIVQNRNPVQENWELLEKD